MTRPEPDSREPARYGQVADLLRESDLPEDTIKDWARFLVGLPWCYVQPLVTISVNTKNPPPTALWVAAAYSEDPEFKAAAKAHLDAIPT